MLSFRTHCQQLALTLGLLGSAAACPAAAQVAFAAPGTRPPFQYMTLTTVESSDPHLAKMLLAPSFEARSEAYLEAYNSFTETGNSWAYRSNQERLTKQLNELATAGWEVFEVHPTPYLPAQQAYSTQYLLRRPRP